MQYAISIPQTVGPEFDPAEIRRFLTRAEELGFDSAWTQEQVLGTAPLLSPITTMTFAAACTTRIRLGCSVFVTPLHNPLQLAKELGSLDQLSKGRLEVGIGTGGRGRPFAAFGLAPEAMLRRFTEGLAVMKALWTEPEVTFDGHFWKLDGASMEPKPVQKPHPPVWFGGSAPAALRRAVRLGNGFFGAGSTTTANFVEQVRLVREALTDEGKDAADFPIAKRVYISVDDDATRARERMAAALDTLYGRSQPNDLIDVAVCGKPQTCIEGLREVVDAGAELLLFTPLFDEAAHLERLAEDIIPEID